ncbi:hypothetical protein B0T20DRAFT_402408 [Sordaria brevicollis]|uniref:Secreted protein n=1 Tax=Sordaria brevicollis TaxID=83679 RepID=A0AAE0UFP5_SORBR|nr:hypothetical protein B0T20DRAFT_402408 [Sordaria brevicollis]
MATALYPNGLSFLSVCLSVVVLTISAPSSPSSKISIITGSRASALSRIAQHQTCTDRESHMMWMGLVALWHFLDELGALHL